MENFKFDNDYSTEISIKEESSSILLYLSDELNVVENIDNIPNEYKNRILNFINKSNEWYFKAKDRIKSETGTNTVIKLMSIYVLSDPEENPIIFGLLYRVSSDIEHGRGMKLEADTMNIIEYGLADVAFC